MECLNDVQADELLGSVRSLEREIADFEAAIATKRTKRDEMLAALEIYIRAENAKAPEITSKSYAVGRIGLRKNPPHIEITGDLPPDSPFVKSKTTYSADKTAIMGLAKAGQELPGFAKFVEGDVTFTYKLI